LTLDPDGFPQLPPGCSGLGSGGTNGRMRIGARNVDLSDLTGTLSDLLGHPVLDKTGLTGKYDFDFEYSMDGLAGPMGVGAGPSEISSATAEGASRLTAALHQQLGLDLRATQAPFEFVVVSRLDRKPD
jgi:uncharacterized protein (TIGR03435 family)